MSATSVRGLNPLDDELSRLRQKNSLHQLPQRRVGRRRIPPQQTPLRTPAPRHAEVLPPNSRAADKQVRVSKRSAGGWTGWDPVSHNNNRGRIRVSDSWAEAPAGPWLEEGPLGDEPIDKLDTQQLSSSAFDVGSVEARLESAQRSSPNVAIHVPGSPPALASPRGPKGTRRSPSPLKRKVATPGTRERAGAVQAREPLEPQAWASSVAVVGRS